MTAAAPTSKRGGRGRKVRPVDAALERALRRLPRKVDRSRTVVPRPHRAQRNGRRGSGAGLQHRSTRQAIPRPWWSTARKVDP